MERMQSPNVQGFTKTCPSQAAIGRARAPVSRANFRKLVFKESKSGRFAHHPFPIFS